MPWNGSGTYSPPAASFPEVNGTVIDASRFNATINDLASGITNAVARDGQNAPTGNLPMGGFKHTGAADGAADGQYVVFGQTGDSGVVGDFGIGTTSPDSPLHVAAAGLATISHFDSTNANGGYSKWSTSGTDRGYVGTGANLIGGALVSDFGISSNTNLLFATGAGVERARFDVNGCLGVGVAPNASRMTVNGGALAAGGNGFSLAGTLTTGRLFAAASGQINALHTWFDASAQELSAGSTAGAISGVSVEGGGTSGGTTSANTVRLWTASLERVRIDASGNVGIGVAPTSKLDVYGNYASFRNGTYSAYLGYGTLAGGGASDVCLRSDTALIFATSGANERARIDNSGNLLVGTTASVWASAGRGLIEVNGTTDTILGMRIAGTRTGYIQTTATEVNLVAETAIPLRFATTAVERMRIDASGNVGIGVTPTSRLDVSGNFLTLRDGTYTGYLGQGTLCGGLASDFCLRSNTNLLFATGGGTEHFRIDSAGRISGTALHNNASSPSGATSQYIASGTYTPTITTVSNATGAATTCRWIRLGNVVKVGGTITFIAFTGSGTANVRISLPLASNFTSTSDASGAIHFSNSLSGGIQFIANTANDTMDLYWSAGSAVACTADFEFTYEVK